MAQSGDFGNEHRRIAPLTRGQAAWVDILRGIQSEHRQVQADVANAQELRLSATDISIGKVRLLQLEYLFNTHLKFGLSEPSLFHVARLFGREEFVVRDETIGIVRYNNYGKKAEFDTDTWGGFLTEKIKGVVDRWDDVNNHVQDVYDGNKGSLRLLFTSAIDDTAGKGVKNVLKLAPLSNDPLTNRAAGDLLYGPLGDAAVKPLSPGKSFTDWLLGPKPDYRLPPPFDKGSDAGDVLPSNMESAGIGFPGGTPALAGGELSPALRDVAIQLAGFAGADQLVSRQSLSDAPSVDDVALLASQRRIAAWLETLSDFGTDLRLSVRPGGVQMLIDSGGNLIGEVYADKLSGEVTLYTLQNREVTIGRNGSVRVADWTREDSGASSWNGQGLELSGRSGEGLKVDGRSAEQLQAFADEQKTQINEARGGASTGDGGDATLASGSEPDSKASAAESDAKKDASPPQATAFQAGWALYQSIQGGNALGIATAGVNAVNTADWYSRKQEQVELLPNDAADAFSTASKALGLVSAGVGLYNALDSGEPLGIAYSTASLAHQATQLWASSVNTTIMGIEAAGDIATAALYAESAALGAAASALGQAVPILGAALALSQGNIIGAVASVLMMVNPVLGMVVMVLSSIFGGDSEPEYDWIPARGEGSYTRGESGAIGIEASGTNTHKSIEQSPAGADTEGASVVAAKLAAALSSLLLEVKASQPDEDGPASLALIPERLPSLHYLGKNAFVIEFSDPVTGEARQVGANILDVERLLVEVAHYAEALAPAWEAAQVEAKLGAGDAHAAETDAQYAHRLNPEASTPAEAGARQTLPALVVDLAGDGIATAKLPEASGRTLAELLEGPVRFDVDADRFLEAVEWPALGDAFLGLDRDGDGRIDSARELLASPDVPVSMRGNELLAWLDANRDGLLDIRDPAFAALKLWLDVNTDARSDPGEVLSLGELGVNSVVLGGASGAMLQPAEGRGLAVHEVALEAERDGVRTALLPGGVLVEAENGLDGQGTDARLLYVSGVVDLSRPEGARAWGIDPALATSRGIPEAEELDPGVEEDGSARASREARRIVLAGAEQGVLFPAVAGALAALGLGAAQSPAAASLGAGRIELVLPDGTIVPLSVPSVLTESVSRPREEEGAAPPMPLLAEPSPTLAEALPEAGSTAIEVETPAVRSGFVAPLAVSEASVPVAAAVPIALEGGTPLIELTAPALVDAPLVSVLAGHEDELIVVSVAELLARAGITGGPESVITWVGEARHGLVGLASTGEVVFVPEADYFGEAGFSYLLADGAGGVTRAWATITLAPVEDAPIAGSDGLLGLEDTTLLLDPGWLLANDRDPDGDFVRFVSVGSASHGTVELQADGLLRFTPAENYFGEARFTYLLADPKGNLTEGNVFIALEGVNDAPIVEAIEFGRPIYAYADTSGYDGEGNFYGGMSAVRDHGQAVALYAAGKALDAAGNPIGASYYQNGTLKPIGFTTEDQQYTDFEGASYAYDDPMIAEGRVIAYDADGDTLTLSVAAQPVHGSATLGLADAWRYGSTFGDGYSGADPFVVRVTDSAGASGSATVSTTHYGTLAHGGGSDGCCPVMIDLDADGVEMIDADDSRLLRDLDGDGWMERLGWSAEDDALLAYDLDDDGFITRAEEISFVGYRPGARTDLEGLAAFDTDGDGKLTANDAQWERFHLWQDRGADGISAPGELTPLTQTDIVAISLTSDGQPEIRGANVLFGRARYERADGSTGEVGDVMFGARETGIPAAPAPSASAEALEAHFARLALQLAQEMAAFDPKAPSELDLPPSAPPSEAPLAENPLQRQEQAGTG